MMLELGCDSICGSDVHYLKTTRCADFVVEEPVLIGHECVSVIEEVGSEVKHLVSGDRVALEPGISCWRCNQCKQGSYNLCPDMKVFATFLPTREVDVLESSATRTHGLRALSLFKMVKST